MEKPKEGEQPNNTESSVRPEQIKYEKQKPVVADLVIYPITQPIVEQKAYIIVYPAQEIIEEPKKPTVFYCRKGGLHSGYILNIVCTYLNCEGYLCCNMCVEESHQHHRVKPLKWLEAEVQEKASKSKVRDDGPIRESVDRIKRVTTAISQSFYKLRYTITSKIDKMGRTINKICIKLYNTFPEELKKEQTESYDYFRDHAFKVLCRYRSMQYEITSEGQVVESQVLRLEAEILNIIEEFDQQVENRQFDQRLKDCMSRQVHREYFGELRHGDMQLCAPSIVRFTNSERYFKIAVLYPPIDMLKRSQYLFRLRKGEWICFGVCLLPIVKYHNFLWKYDRIGHGVYGMSASGKAFSHTRADYNYVDKVCDFDYWKGFKFGAHDIVSIIVNGESQTLKISCKDKNNECNINVAWAEEMYVCAILSTIGSEAEYLGHTY